MKILKFGGTSVGSPESILQVADIVQNAWEAGSVAVVVSAFGGLTDELINAAKDAARGETAFRGYIGSWMDRHVAAVQRLVSAKRQSALVAQVTVLLNELEEHMEAVRSLGELSPKSLDAIASIGERLSAPIVAAALCENGVDSASLDARSVIVTDDRFGNARVQMSPTRDRLRAHFANNAYVVQVVTGFVAATEDGRTTTLGRGGSDYTAALLGELLDAEEIEIWTDVNGVMTANPKRVPSAFPLDHLTYEEAMELSHFGAKVLYAPTMEPARRAGIPIRVRNTFEPAFPGTVIRANGTARAHPVAGISSLEDIALLRLEGSGIVGIAGSARILFDALADAGVNVIMISQGSSELSICVAVRGSDAQRAQRAVEKAFEREIAHKTIDGVTIEPGHAIVAVAGEGMHGRSGTCKQLFAALGDAGINVKAIAQGSSERNISLVVAGADENRALNAVHDAFFGARTLDLFVVGTGTIGSALLDMIRDHQDILGRERGVSLRLCGIANSKTTTGRPNSINPSSWESALASGGPADLPLFLERIPRGAVLADCTASSETYRDYARLLEKGIHVVTPNKKSLCVAYDAYRMIRDAERSGGARFLYETTVGAGLPVIGTLKNLLATGDRIRTIEAVLSGTLSYLFNSFDGSEPFSALVRRARDAGYTEPDPRDDLSGTDVARKLLILARECGIAMELVDISVENLVPLSCADAGSPEEFLELLGREDAAFEARRSVAAAHGARLCFIARIENGTARVALETIDASHPFAGLQGTDNIVAFTTDRYQPQPLVIRGPGAGPAVTAAGVLADILACQS